MSNKAKYYIYRNLTKGGFSVKYRGKVIDHANCIFAFDVDFKVNQKGRERVLREKKKYVHAYVVCDHYQVMDDAWQQVCKEPENFEVKYNPFKSENFMIQNFIAPNVSGCIMGNGKVFVSHDVFKSLFIEE